MKPALNKRHHQIKSNYSTPSIKLYFPKITHKQSKTTQLIKKIKIDSINFSKKRRRRIQKKKMINILHPSSLPRILRPTRITRSHQCLIPNTNDHDKNFDTSSNLEKQSDNSSTSSSYQPSHSSSYDESNNSLKLKVSSCKRILFPKQSQPEDHSQSSSIDIHNIHPQTNHRTFLTFPLMFPKIDSNIINLNTITRNNTHQHEDIPLTICSTHLCHEPISPISSSHASPRYTPDPVNHQQMLIYDSTPLQTIDLTKRLFHPLRHQQGIWSMNRMQTYCPLYLSLIHI